MTLELAAFFHHLYSSVVYLHYWANFNLIMMLQTEFTAYLTICSLMLLWKVEAWLHADYSARFIAFLASLVTTTNFFGHLVGVASKWHEGWITQTFNIRSVFNILTLYTLMLEIGAVIPAIHIFLYEALALTSNSIFHPDWKGRDDHLWSSKDDGIDKAVL